MWHCMSRVPWLFLLKAKSFKWIYNFTSLSLICRVRQFFWVVLEYELRALLLLGKSATTWATSPAPVIIFQIGSCAFFPG
jgi:hypothetical protein